MILALDFDGVLHPANSWRDLPFSHLGMLEGWLRQWPQVDVVISSSWKEVHPFRELVEFFSEDLQHRVVGCTPSYGRMHPQLDDWLQILPAERERPLFKREAEIRRWIRDSWAPHRPWVALDDMPELFQPGCAELVVCNPRVGLTPAQLEELTRRVRSSGERR